MGEAIKNLVVLMWTVSAINSGANARVVSEYSVEEEVRGHKVVAVSESVALSKNAYVSAKKRLLSVNNS